MTKADATINLSALSDLSYTSTPISLAATSEDGRPITYFVTGVATAVSNEVALTSAGSITVVAYVEGTSNYNGAYVTVNFTVSKAAANLTMGDVLADYDGSGKTATAVAKDSSGNTLDVTVGIVYTDSSDNVVTIGIPCLTNSEAMASAVSIAPSSSSTFSDE